VIVEKDGKFLTGFRHHDYCAGTLCGPGGHVEGLETARQAAIRETQEEFGITPTELIFLGLGEYEEDSGLIPAVFLCTKCEGIIENSDMEMIDIRFRTIEEILECDLFKPFENSLLMLADTLKNEEISQKLLTKFSERDIMYQEDGGAGSGNFGHGGRPGQIGGSSPEPVSSSVLRNKIKNGEVSTKIKPRQQKHFKDTELYKSECQKAQDENRPLPGYLTITEDELSEILTETRGKGNVMKIGNSYREFVDAGKVVGVYVDRYGNEKPTTKLMVHYGYEGCHAVPGNPYYSAAPQVKDETEKKPETKSETKPEQKPEQKTETKPEQKPGQKTGVNGNG
jgi:8-oxo-dGTP pyrophosphatase MutT (NUDIX family)